jgi:hypothetical protein
MSDQFGAGNRPEEQRPATVPQCPVCTTILHNEARRKVMLGKLASIAKIETERNGMMALLYAILREHGGEIVVRRIPTDEEVGAAKIEYRTDQDGSLRISLPKTVIVEAGALIRTEG